VRVWLGFAVESSLGTLTLTKVRGKYEEETQEMAEFKAKLERARALIAKLGHSALSKTPAKVQEAFVQKVVMDSPTFSSPAPVPSQGMKRVLDLVSVSEDSEEPLHSPFKKLRKE
jgi:hypothetical protein